MVMTLGDPRDVFLTDEMRRFMADPVAMRFARQMLFEARPLLRFVSLNAEWIIRHLATTSTGVREQQVKLSFDGRFLRWREVGDGKIVRHSWRAVSGRPGYQSKEHQRTEKQGPLPEGKWLVKQSEYQSAAKRSLWEQMKNTVGRGKWPGGTRSWGLHRVWLLPDAGTETYGREGFSIHGGTTPGSAGCIDMTDQIEAFIDMFLDYGKDIELEVKYP